MNSALANSHESSSDVSQRSVLIIEDDPSINEVLQVFFEQEGFHSTSASNGQEAFELLKTKSLPDFIMLDLMMPVMNGWQFLEAMKTDPRLAAIPVIVLTAYSDKANDIQVHRVLKKPIDLNLLSQTAKEIIGAQKPPPNLTAVINPAPTVARLLTAIRTAKMGIWEWDIAKNSVSWQGSLDTIYDLSQGEAPRTFEEYISLVYPDDREVVQNAVTSALVTKNANYVTTHRVLLPNNEIRWIEGRGHIFRDSFGNPTHMIGIVTDVTKTHEAEATVLKLTQRTSACIGSEFFRRTVQVLAESIGADLTFIGQLTPGHLDQIEMLAIWADGAPAKPIIYPLLDTPCANVVSGKVCAYDNDVTKVFPRDLILVEMKAEAYIGIPLFGSNGRGIGLMVAIFRRPIRNSSFFESTISILSDRVSAEIQRTRLEQDLVNSNRRLSAILSNTPNIAIQGYDHTGRITLWNKASETLYGWSNTEAQGKTLREVGFSEDTEKQLNAAISRISLNGLAVGPYEYEYTAKNGRKGTVMSTIFGVPDAEGRTTFICTEIDVTERIQMELDREKSRRQLALLAQLRQPTTAMISLDIVLKNASKLITSELAEWCFIALDSNLTHSPHFVVSHRDIYIERTMSDLSETCIELSYQTSESSSIVQLSDLTSVRTLFGDEKSCLFQILTASKSPIALALSLISSQRKNIGTMYLGFKTIHDAQVNLIFAKEISSSVAITLDNALLYKDSQNAVKIREEFIAVASHELRTPLTALRAQYDLLKRLIHSYDDQPNIPKASLKRITDLSVRDFERFGKLIENLLDLTQLKLGRLQLFRERFDLNEILVDSLRRLEHLIDKSGCEVHMRHSESVIGFWDKSRIEEVINNLITNATKFGKGKPIEISLNKIKNGCQLSIQDHGIGIPKDKLSVIFERFERAVSEKHFGGLGLGLSISKKIIEAHGGHISVESTLGQGSQFVVELPN